MTDVNNNNNNNKRSLEETKSEELSSPNKQPRRWAEEMELEIDAKAAVRTLFEHDPALAACIARSIERIRQHRDTINQEDLDILNTWDSLGEQKKWPIAHDRVVALAEEIMHDDVNIEDLVLALAMSSACVRKRQFPWTFLVDCLSDEASQSTLRTVLAKICEPNQPNAFLVDIESKAKFARAAAIPGSPEESLYAFMIQLSERVFNCLNELLTNDFDSESTPLLYLACELNRDSVCMALCNPGSCGKPLYNCILGWFPNQQDECTNLSLLLWNWCDDYHNVSYGRNLVTFRDGENTRAYVLQLLRTYPHMGLYLGFDTLPLYWFDCDKHFDKDKDTRTWYVHFLAKKIAANTREYADGIHTEFQWLYDEGAERDHFTSGGIEAAPFALYLMNHLRENAQQEPEFEYTDESNYYDSGSFLSMDEFVVRLFSENAGTSWMMGHDMVAAFLVWLFHATGPEVEESVKHGPCTETRKKLTSLIDVISLGNLVTSLREWFDYPDVEVDDAVRASKLQEFIASMRNDIVAAELELPFDLSGVMAGRELHLTQNEFHFCTTDLSREEVYGKVFKVAKTHAEARALYSVEGDFSSSSVAKMHTACDIGISSVSWKQRSVSRAMVLDALHFFRQTNSDFDTGPTKPIDDLAMAYMEAMDSLVPPFNP